MPRAARRPPPAIGGMFAALDVADEAGMAAALDAAEARHGVARILVNCAGIAPGRRIVDREGQPHPLGAYRKAIEVNLIGTFNALANSRRG